MRFPHGVPVARRGGDTWPHCATWEADGKLTACLPYGAEVHRGDVLDVEGRVWLVTGGVESRRSPFTGWAPGTVVTCSPALAEVRVDRPGAPAFNPETGRTETPYSLAWEGPAFVPIETSAHPTSDVGGVVVRTDRTILLPSGADVQAEDRVTVSSDDPLTPAVWWVSLVHLGPWPSERAVLVREVR